jgi:anti-sigma factor ChrR (cupin superfamily)
MGLAQDIRPVNPELMDTLVEASKMEWIETSPGRAYMKILWVGSESGRWSVLFRWRKGYVASKHKHLSASHTFILSGKLQVRDGVLNAGDYVYEPNGMLHGATTALEDTEYLFICDGPILFYNDDGLTSYLGWEELTRMRQRIAKAAENGGATANGHAKPQS